MDQPITERRNELTVNIDTSSPLEMVDLFHECNKQIFHGYDHYPALLDKKMKVIRKYCCLAEETIQTIKVDKGLVVLSGSGTSGRLAFLIARSFNEKLVSAGYDPCFRYLIGGGDKALFVCLETAEDQPLEGVKDLEQLTEGYERVLFIGISCGLSAPYVAGQLDYCMAHLDIFVPVLLGFNPISMARKTLLTNWKKTFHDVAMELQVVEKNGQGYIINPVIGPEPITGSSRMKGGSATKILLEVILSSALQRLLYGHTCRLETCIQAYETVLDCLHEQRHQISEVVQLAASCLKMRSKSSILYIGSQTRGILGIIDASECRPTFGASLDEVRGFCIGGYSVFQNREGPLDYQISDDDIKRNHKATDLVIELLATDDRKASFKTEAKRVLVTVDSDIRKVSRQSGSEYAVIVSVILPRQRLEEQTSPQHIEFCWDFLCDIAVKWVCNAVTTGAYTLAGKIYQNCMIDLCISNIKLFHRALRTIQMFSSKSAEEAKEALLQVIYQGHVTDANRGTIVTEHVMALANRQCTQVVPTALLIAILKCPLAEAERALQVCQVPRQAVHNALESC